MKYDIRPLVGPRQRSPLRLAAAISIFYLVISVAWILYSDHLAELVAQSTEELARIQRYKGLGFVFTSAVFLFLLGLYLFRLVANENQAALRAQQALSELERSAIAGIILQSLVHDFRNHTQVAWGNIQLLQMEQAGLPDPQQEMLHRIRHSVAQLIETLDRNRAAGVRTFTQNSTPMDLAEYVKMCVDLVRSHPTVAGCDVRWIAPHPVPFTGHKPLIHDAITNLVLNAAEAMGGAGRIQVRIFPQPDGAGIEVHDSGPGVPAAERNHVFTAFYTTKAAGTGLGLLSVKACAEVHHGAVSVTQSELGGACFRLDLRNVPHGAAGAPEPPMSRALG